MAKVKYTGTGAVGASDFKAVKWVGLTKGGEPITIEFEKAINMGNIDWTFADKNDTVAEIVMTSVYSNTDEASSDTTEPWTIEVDETLAGAAEIMLGSGVLYIDDNKIALTRGGGKFSVAREFREIEADGDRGPVEGRIVMDKSTATLSMNALTILSRFADLYAGIKTVINTVK